MNNGKYWDRAWSLVDGCTPCSPGCDHCWSRSLNSRFGKWPDKVTPRPDRLTIPLSVKKPHIWCIWNDLFHEDVSIEFIDDVLEVISACPQHIFFVLTKRDHLIEEKLYDSTADHGCRVLGGGDYLRNLWVGVTVCNQQEADIKIPMLLESWPGKKWLSIEPMLGPVSIEEYCMGFDPYWTPDRDDDGLVRLSDPGIHWIVCGGETGPHARPIHRNWVRSIRDQCATAGVPFFFKQWGEYLTIPEAADLAIKTDIIDLLNANSLGGGFLRVGTKRAGRLLDGREWNERPGELYGIIETEKEN